MTTTRIVLTALVLLCLIAFVRSVHAHDAGLASPDAPVAQPSER